MKQYIEVSGSLYEFKEMSCDCRGCAFEDDDSGCGLAQGMRGCTGSNGQFRLVAEKKPAVSQCGECVHESKSGAEEPCRSCNFAADAPTGWYPKFEPRPPIQPKQPGPITIQLQQAKLPEIPDGPGWTDVGRSGMLPCGYHQNVDVQFRDGAGGSFLAGNVDWSQRGESTDVVRYRVAAEPARNGREAKVIPIVPEQASVVDDFPEDWPPLTRAQQSAIEADLGQAASLPDAGSKPTNPKDIIGIRKVPMSAVPAGVMMEVALALGEGAAKYGRHNYRGVGVRASVYYDATVGHLFDWWEGEDIDPDSDLSHVTKAIASLTVLRDAMLQGKLTDDRPPRSKVFKRDFNPKMGQILDRHADKSPKHWTISD